MASTSSAQASATERQHQMTTLATLTPDTRAPIEEDAE